MRSGKVMLRDHNPDARLTLSKSSPDNCLRALSKVPASAPAFCLTYTTQVITATTGLPAFLANCEASSSRISSACSCIAPAVTSIVSVSSTSSITSSTSSLTSSTTSSSPSACPSLPPDTSTVTLVITNYLYFTSTAVETDDLFYTSTAIETDVESITFPPTTITITQNVALPASTITSTALYCNGTTVPYNGIPNPGFESGTLGNWICDYSCEITTKIVHSSTYAL